MANLLNNAVSVEKDVANNTANILGNWAIDATKNSINSYGDALQPLFKQPVAQVQQPNKPVAAPKPVYGDVYRDTARAVPFSDKDLALARNVIYAEVSNRTPDKQQLEAKVILNTALNRLALNRKLQRGPQTLEGVFTQTNQYQGYDPNNENPNLKPGQLSQYNQALKGVLNKQRAAAIDAVLGQAKTGKLADNTNGSFYYIHNKDGSITYDDLRKLYQ